MSDLDPGDEFAGCRIEAVAGRGGMGVVYRATQLGLGRPVALKLLAADRAGDPDFRERFQRESRMAAAIDHPNVIPVYAAGEEEGRLYLVMRYVGGTDLQALLRAEGALAPERAAGVIAQIAAALDAAHRAGLVHRDVKPANVLLSGEHAYLSDFGLTRVVDSDTAITEAGQWIGTVDYASPEQLRGDRTDARADVYSLGCVLHAALTGRAPFNRGTVPATMAAQLHEPPPHPSDEGAPREFDRVIARALAKEPGDRYPSAGDLGRAALAAVRGERVTESERSVARGPAAPDERATHVMNGGEDATHVLGDGDETHVLNGWGAAAEPTRLEPPPPLEPEPEPARQRLVEHPARFVRRALAAFILLAALGVALGALLDGGGSGARSGPLSPDEVRSAAQSFADAYSHEDSAALRRTLARDVLRVLPSGVSRGRNAVAAQYARQFDGKVRSYDLSDVHVTITDGNAGRASAGYRVERDGEQPIQGRIVFGVVRERGHARIALIAATPAT